MTINVTSSDGLSGGLCESRREIVTGRNGKNLPAALLFSRPVTGVTNARPPAANFVTYPYIRRNSTNFFRPGVLDHYSWICEGR